MRPCHFFPRREGVYVPGIFTSRMKGIDGGYKLSELLSGKGGQILDL